MRPIRPVASATRFSTCKLFWDDFPFLPVSYLSSYFWSNLVMCRFVGLAAMSAKDCRMSAGCFAHACAEALYVASC